MAQRIRCDAWRKRNNTVILRLQLALASKDAIAIDAAQTYWLRVAEVLRRLDRELEFSRRTEQRMIPCRIIWSCEGCGKVEFVSAEGPEPR
jgi:hypothetical protein